MAEIDRKIADKVLQLGSLNDELKQVAEQTNQKNKELAELDFKLKELNESISNAEQKLENYKNKNLNEESRYKEQVKILVEEQRLKQKDIDLSLSFIKKLENNKRDLKDEIKSLEVTKLELSKLQNKLETLKVKETIYDKLILNISKLTNQESILRQTIVELNSKIKDLRIKLDLDKKNHREWLKSTKQTADKTMDGSIDRIDNLEKTRRDLRVVAKRLKKIWEQTSSLPFPKIYDA